MLPSIPASLLTELRSLTEPDRRAVLGAFTPDERKMLTAVFVGDEQEVSMTPLSPWMAELGDEAARVLAGDPSGRLTSAAAEALMGLAPPVKAAAPIRGPSLLDGLKQALPSRPARK